MSWPTDRSPFGPNRTPSLMGLSAIDEETIVPVAVDPLTGAILTESTSSGDTTLSTYIDKSGTPIYVGEAAVGSSTADPVWQISAIDASSSPITVLYAGGGNFNQIWDNRDSLVYS